MCSDCLQIRESHNQERSPPTCAGEHARVVHGWSLNTPLAILYGDIKWCHYSMKSAYLRACTSDFLRFRLQTSQSYLRPDCVPYSKPIQRYSPCTSALSTITCMHPFSIPQSTPALAMVLSKTRVQWIIQRCCRKLWLIYLLSIKTELQFCLQIVDLTLQKLFEQDLSFKISESVAQEECCSLACCCHCSKFELHSFVQTISSFPTLQWGGVVWEWPFWPTWGRRHKMLNRFLWSKTGNEAWWLVYLGLCFSYKRARNRNIGVNSMRTKEQILIFEKIPLAQVQHWGLCESLVFVCFVSWIKESHWAHYQGEMASKKDSINVFHLVLEAKLSFLPSVLQPSGTKDSDQCGIRINFSGRREKCTHTLCSTWQGLWPFSHLTPLG